MGHVFLGAWTLKGAFWWIVEYNLPIVSNSCDIDKIKNELILSRLYYHLKVEVGSLATLAMLVMSPEGGFQRFASYDLLLLHSVLWEGEEELEVPPPWASA